MEKRYIQSGNPIIHALFILCLFLAASCKTTAEYIPPPVPVSAAPAAASVRPVPGPAIPGTSDSPESTEPEIKLPVPKIIVSGYQETVYTGFPQSVKAGCEPELPLIITYFSNLDDYWMIRNGFYDPPTEPGVYLVSVDCAPGYGYAQVDDILVEFRIKRAPVRIVADSSQSAVFNGNPKRVQAASEPNVPLSFSYYPNPELRQAAVEVFNRPDRQSSLASALQGFTRVESAPVEQGIYYVLVYFNGNDKYEPAYKEIEFVINPAARRN